MQPQQVGLARWPGAPGAVAAAAGETLRPVSEIGLDADVPAGPATSRRVVAWGYTSAAASGGHAWLACSMHEAISQPYLDLLAAPAAAA